MNFLIFSLTILLSFLILIELTLRIIKNTHRGQTKSESINTSHQVPSVDISSKDPKLGYDELSILKNEYEAHVRACMTHHGNWAESIKSENEIHMPDFGGKFLNVANGLRVTTKAFDSASQRFFIFGGSTVFCGEVSDKFTFCSQVQNKIHEYNLRTTVLNYGRHGSTFKNRIAYLERCDVRRGDLVLFWFGVNELGWKLLEGKTNLSFLQKILFTISEGLKFGSRFSILLRISSDFYQKFSLPAFQSFAYFETKKSFKRLDDLSKALFFHYKIILQPNLLTKAHKSVREETMHRIFLSKHKGQIIRRLHDANYPRFRNLLSEFNGHDASAILNTAVGEVFVDWVHLNSEGNRLVAEFVFEKFNTDSRFSSQ